MPSDITILSVITLNRRKRLISEKNPCSGTCFCDRSAKFHIQLCLSMISFS